MDVIFSPGDRIRTRWDLAGPDGSPGGRPAGSRGTVVSYARIDGNYVIQFDEEDRPRDIFHLHLTELHPLEVLAEAAE